MPRVPRLHRRRQGLPGDQDHRRHHARQPHHGELHRPSHEHVSHGRYPHRGFHLQDVETAIPGRLLNVHAAPCGGGKFVAIMQFKKSSKNDEGRQRNAAMLAFSAFSELKHVILVDEDVDIFDMSDVMWAMTTRFQADVTSSPSPAATATCSTRPTTPRSILDSRAWHRCKAIFDCTVPFDLKKNFIRSQFMEIDKDKWPRRLLSKVPAFYRTRTTRRCARAWRAICPSTAKAWA